MTPIPPRAREPRPSATRQAEARREAPTIYEFRFLLAGAASDDAAREQLRESLLELLESQCHIGLLAVNEGLRLDLEVTDTGPFSVADYEDYLIDHVLAPTLGQQSDGAAIRIRPLKSRHIRRD
ncbi:MAG: hypothetical protein AAGI15_02645 [Pseudomonadota bacterium]